MRVLRGIHPYYEHPIRTLGIRGFSTAVLLEHWCEHAGGPKHTASHWYTRTTRVFHSPPAAMFYLLFFYLQLLYVQSPLLSRDHTPPHHPSDLPSPPSDSVTLLPGGRLHLSDVSAAQAGTYSCAATNHLTGETVTAPFVTRLEVRQPQRSSAPRLVVPPEPIYSVQAGSTLR